MNTTTINIHYPTLLDLEIVDDTIGYIAACIEDACEDAGVPVAVNNDSTTISVIVDNANLRLLLDIEEMQTYLGCA
jgi:hypothetical protein